MSVVSEARSSTGKGKSDRYWELIRALPLRPIRCDSELERAIAMIDSLIDRAELSQGEQDYLEVLGDLVEKYEAKEHPIAPVSDAEMLSHLIDAKGVNQSKVAADTRIAESTISELLSGRRALNRHHIGILSKYFHVSPSIFEFD